MEQRAGATLAPLPSAVAHLPFLCVSPELAQRVRQGHRSTVAALPIPSAPAAAVFDEQRNLIAMITHTEGYWKIARGF